MDKQKEQLLDLINSALWGTPAHAELFGEGTDWNALYQTAKEQACLGLAFQGFSTLPNDKKPNRILLLKWYGFVAEMENQYNHHLEILGQAFQLFGKERPILMKGLSVAALYPNPKIRHLGDIDLLLPEMDGKEMQKLLRSKGFDVDSCPHTDKHIGIDLKGVEIELHWEIGKPLNPFHHKTYKMLERQATKITREETIGEVKVNLLPLEFNAIALLIHMVEHFIGKGLGLRQICDWTLFLDKYHSKMDHNLLKEMLNELGMMNDWQLFSNFCVNNLGLNKEAAIFYSESKTKKAQKLSEVVFAFGNFGEYNPVWKSRPSAFLKRKMEALKGNIEHFLRVFSISPSNALFNIFYFYPIDAFNRLKNRK